MNMLQILLEGMSSAEIDEKVKSEAKDNFTALRDYKFPITLEMAQKSASPKIRSMITQTKDGNGNAVKALKPITFEWAADTYDGKDKAFLLELAASILPKSRVRSVFIKSAKTPEALEKYARQYPAVASIKCGVGQDGIADAPKVFELFLKLIGTELTKSAENSFVVKENEKGEPTLEKRQDERMLNVVSGSKYVEIEDALERNYKQLSGKASVPNYGDFDDTVLYAAFIKYIFDFMDDARKMRKEASDKRDNASSVKELFTRDPHDVAKSALEPIYGNSDGVQTNWGSLANMGESQMKVISPDRLTAANIPDVLVYPRYVVDVLALPGDAMDAFCNILKEHNYTAIARELEENGKPTGVDQQNKVLAISTKDFIEMLRDETLIRDCVANGYGDIFNKHGDRWVIYHKDKASGRFVVDSINLDKALNEQPKRSVADKNNLRAVAVAEGMPSKNTNTEREFTGNGVVNTAHIDMGIGAGIVVKGQDTKRVTPAVERLRDEDVPLDEWLSEMKAAIKMGDDVGANTHIAQNLENVTTRTGFEAEARFVFKTVDGAAHEIQSLPGIDKTLAKTDLKNIISRKVKSTDEGHVYFLAIPHGMAFVAMQDADGDMVNNETVKTLSHGLRLHDHDVVNSSVNDVLNSPIGKYCGAVAKHGMAGRIMFNSKEANDSFKKVLEALRSMKSEGMTVEFTSPKDMSGVVQLFNEILSSMMQQAEERMDTIKPFVNPAKPLVIHYEEYNPKTGHFNWVRPTFDTVNKDAVPKRIVNHLKDMYNLDSTLGYSKDDVEEILDAVAPNRWNLTDWDYKKMLQAAKAMDADANESAPVDEGTDSNSEDEFSDSDIAVLLDAFNKAYAKAFPEEYEPFDADDAQNLKDAIIEELNKKHGTVELASAVEDITFRDFDDFIHRLEDRFTKDEAGNYPIETGDSEEIEVRKPDADDMQGEPVDTTTPGNKDEMVAKQAYQEALDEVTGGKDKAILTADEVASLRDKLAEKLLYLQNNGELNIKIAHLVKNDIDVRNKFDFNHQFLRIVHDAVAASPDVDDNTVRMDSLLGDDADASPAPMYFTKQVLRGYLGTGQYDDTDKKIIPTMGALMVKYAAEDASKNDVNPAFDRDTLVDSFNANFADELQEKIDALNAVSKSDLGGMDDARQDSVQKQLKAEVITYAAINKKIHEDGEYVAKVADIVVRNGAAIRRDALGMKVDGVGMMVPFVASTVQGFDSPGNRIIDFCVYNFEKNNASAELGKVTNAFRNSNALRVMMNRLRQTVPEDSLSIDYRNGIGDVSRIDAMPYKSISENELSSLKSYFNKADLKAKYAQVADDIKDVYANDIGRFVEADGVKSPYTFDGKNINLHKVKDFFTSLMDLAEEYNTVGHGKRNTKMTYRQQTMNNEEQRKKTVINEHFASLYSAFTNTVNKLSNGEPLQAVDVRILNTVMREVVMNPMSVLVNNNARLITAFAYYEEGLKARARDASPSGADYGRRDVSKETGRDREVIALNKNVAKAVHAGTLAFDIRDDETLALEVSQIKIPFEKARADFNRYREEYGRRYPDAVDIMNKADDQATLDKETANKIFFKDYPVRDKNGKVMNTFKGDTLARYRISELKLLEYRLAREILNAAGSRGFGNNRAEFIELLASQAKALSSEGVKSGRVRLVDEALLDELVNVDAELALATGAFNDSPNNSPATSARNFLRGKTAYPTTSVDDLIQNVISDDAVDDNKLQDMLADMDREGNPDLKEGSAINFNATMDVIDVDDAGTMRITASTILHEGDTLLVQVNGTTRVSDVKTVNYETVVNKKGEKKQRAKDYIVTRVYWLNKGDKDIPFGRFQIRNSLGCRALEDRFNDVMRKLSDWRGEYENKVVPAQVMKKLHYLKLLYGGSQVSAVMKSAIEYFAWSVSNFNDESLRPKTKIDFGGEPINGQCVRDLVTAIASDLIKYGPDSALGRRIVDLLPDDFVDLAGSLGISINTALASKLKAMGNAQILKATSSDVKTKKILEELVDKFISAHGCVRPAWIAHSLNDPNTQKEYGITPEDVNDIVNTMKGAYKDELYDIIMTRNWVFAKPLVLEYQQSTDAPTYDGAIKYLEENYKAPAPNSKLGGAKFAKCISDTCKGKIQTTLGVS